MKKKKISHVNCHLSLVTCHMYTLKCTPGITRSSESIDMLRYESQFYAVRLSEALSVGRKSIVGTPPFLADVIWVTFPSLHIEHKLVTFWESLSHFCDQIQNGTIQTENIFLANFLGRVRIFNHILCRVIFKTPREIRI